MLILWGMEGQGGADYLPLKLSGNQFGVETRLNEAKLGAAGVVIQFGGD